MIVLLWVLRIFEILLLLALVIVLAVVVYFRTKPPRPNPLAPYRPGFFDRLGSIFFQALNAIVPWHRLPPWFGVLNLVSLRNDLRQHNLTDTSVPLSPVPKADPIEPCVLVERASDGSYNDLGHPTMGMAGARFGRNVPREKTWPEDEAGLLSPNPRTVSIRLMTRDEGFKPATSLNLLAAAWIQFNVHDWFTHGDNRSDAFFDLPLTEDDPWPDHPMRIAKTLADTTRDPTDQSEPPTYQNLSSHWWDTSCVYGSDTALTDSLRSHRDGKLTVREGRLPLDPKTGISITGFSENWWLGLGMLHTLFSLEHNAICDRLRLEFPEWSDEQLFQRARLVNSALIAKIHTVEWTPGILAHPTLQIAMRANWWGLASERVRDLVGRISEDEAISGIPGSAPDHHGAPFALTEEFVAVYRLHPLVPDEFEMRDAETDRVLKRLTFREASFHAAETVIDETVSVVDAFYTFGTSNPGAITLHNYPHFLQNLVKPDGSQFDLASVDILRDRERGVPRYNEFRRALRMKPAATFEAMTSNRKWSQELKEVYGDVERVDLLTGMLAEDLPKGFGFSDTAFRIFILMASRRLKSDRFFTTDFTPQMYSKVGIDWIAENSMVTVLLRHYPELAPSLRGVKNAFAPWNRITDYAGPAASTR